ncbi:MAG: hypothetical protein JEZ14_06595 [Marinilabiliaceae bacterium]|nr:hypothetical protein [Marinilabiliaceae bacterium]
MGIPIDEKERGHYESKYYYIFSKHYFNLKSIYKGSWNFLASDCMEGRHTEERGAYMAVDYIAIMYRVYGLKPGGDEELIFRF